MRHGALSFLALATTATLSERAFADTRPDHDPATRIAALERQVRDLQAANGDRWLTERRAMEIRSLMQDVLADADTRASLLQGGATAGWDKKFFLGSAEGNFRLNVEGQLQIRYVFNHQEEDASDDSSRGGFENRRTKLTFAGNVVDPSWKYHVTGAFGRDGGSFELEDAYVEKDFDNGWSVRIGQFKLPFMFEELVSSKRQQAVDRSLVNEEFNQDRSQGVMLTYEADRFRLSGAFSDGFGSANTPALAEDTEWAFTGRGEMLLAGDWKQFADFASWKGEDFGAQIGAAVHGEKQESGTAAGPEETLFTYTVDAALEFGGANVFGAIVGRSFDEADADQWGFMLQGGFFVTDDVELFARYEWGDLDEEGAEDMSVITAGVTKYWSKHSLKWTTDVGFGLDEVESDFASSGAGWRGDVDDENSQIVFRTQLQLLF